MTLAPIELLSSPYSVRLKVRSGHEEPATFHFPELIQLNDPITQRHRLASQHLQFVGGAIVLATVASSFRMMPQDRVVFILQKGSDASPYSEDRTKASQLFSAMRWPRFSSGAHAAFVAHSSMRSQSNALEKKKPELLISPGFSFTRSVSQWQTQRSLIISYSISAVNQPSAN